MFGRKQTQMQTVGLQSKSSAIMMSRYPSKKNPKPDDQKQTKRVIDKRQKETQTGCGN